MNCIVVADRNWAIGCEGGLLFSLPTDMRRFRTLTMGGTVILGRKTLDSFPGGRPLPGRRNIVITRNPDFHREGCEIVPTPQAALDLAAGTPDEQLWVIGGGSVYTALLPLCRHVYLTRVDAEAPEADTFFPNLDKLPGWDIQQDSGPMEENGLTFRFVDYLNRTV